MVAKGRRDAKSAMNRIKGRCLCAYACMNVYV